MLKTIIAAVFAVLGGAIAASAAAQETSNPTFSGAPMMSLISASDVADMMTELGVSTQLTSADDGGAPFLVAQTPGGGRFLFRFLGCQDAALATGCRNTIVTAALPGLGKTYDDINDFNGNSVVTTAVNVPGEQMVLFGRNIIVLGGHSRELFKGTVFLFLNDVQQFSATQAATSVAFEAGPDESSKISGIGARSVSETPETFFGVTDISPEIAAAIANTRDTDFAVEYASGL